MACYSFEVYGDVSFNNDQDGTAKTSPGQSMKPPYSSNRIGFLVGLERVMASLVSWSMWKHADTGNFLK